MTTTETPLVSIIIVNYNTTKFIIPCIQSIYNHCSSPFEVIVVENNPCNSCIPEVNKKFVNVRTIQMTDNVGFSAGNNSAIKKANGTYLLFLNPDTILSGDSITACINFLKQRSDQLIMLGCRLLNQDQTLQYSFHWSSVTMQKAIQSNPLYIKLFDGKIRRRSQRNVELKHKSISEVDWLSGAFLMMDKKKLLKYSLFFDEDFFLYSEDVELCHRVRKAGGHVVYYPEASVIHIGSSGKNPWHSHHRELIFSEWLCMMKIRGKIYFMANQNLLLLNFLLDQLLFYKGKLFGKPEFGDLKSFLIRKKTMKLWRRHTLEIILRYKRTTNFKHIKI